MENVGLGLVLTPVPPGQPPGVFGDLDLGFGFKAPDGLGLVVQAGPVTGGGFLFFDADHEQYAGALELEFSGIALKAVGVLTTRLPGGAPGFSLLIIISAEFTPIQLGLGFTLNGVGGLLGINRTVAIEPLRAGLKANALGAILFPQDPVGHAQQLVATLSTVFPPAAGRHVFGPMARIGSDRRRSSRSTSGSCWSSRRPCGCSSSGGSGRSCPTPTTPSSSCRWTSSA